MPTVAFSLVPPETINHHLANYSPTKQVHQFSKTPRFLTSNPECPNAFYTYDSQLSKRKTSFGYGRKYDFTRPYMITPSATEYKHKSVFYGKNRGQTFGLSRYKLPDRSYLIPQIHKHPGVGHYENQIRTRMSTSYTMRPKTHDFIDARRTNRDNPGPDTYHSIELENYTGRFRISKFKDSQFAKINPKTPRFPYAKDTPGPLNYREVDNLSERAKYILSNHRSNGTRPFPNENRFTIDFWKNNSNPGPADYEKPSEFGVYGDNKYFKKLSKTS